MSREKTVLWNPTLNDWTTTNATTFTDQFAQSERVLGQKKLDNLGYLFTEKNKLETTHKRDYDGDGFVPREIVPTPVHVEEYKRQVGMFSQGTLKGVQKFRDEILNEYSKEHDDEILHKPVYAGLTVRIAGL